MTALSTLPVSLEVLGDNSGSTSPDPLRELYLGWKDRFANETGMTLSATRDLYDGWGRAAKEAPGVSYESGALGTMDALWAIPPEARDKHVVLFAHGGGYMGGSPDSHRKLAGHIALASGLRVVLFDYRLLPEGEFPRTILEDGRAALGALEKLGYATNDVVLMGDSAGGGLVTLLSLQLRDLGLELPKAVVALSPMYDLVGDLPSMVENIGPDVLSSMEGLLELSRMLTGGRFAPDDPTVNPLYADLSGLPPFFVTASRSEGLRDDTVKFVERATAAGSPAEASLTPDMQHVFQFLAGSHPAADASVAEIGAFVRKHTA